MNWDDIPDTPLPDPRFAERRRAGEVENALEDIQDILNTGKARWASETLEGIYETIQKTGRVSEGQRRAIDNIREQAEKPRYRRRRW